MTNNVKKQNPKPQRIDESRPATEDYQDHRFSDKGDNLNDVMQAKPNIPVHREEDNEQSGGRKK